MEGRQRTLMDTETRLRPLVVAALVVSSVLAAFLAHAALKAAQDAWAVAVAYCAIACWLAPMAVVFANVVRNARVTMGSVPIAAVAPLALSCVAAALTSGAVRAVAVVTLAIGLVVALFLAFWFCRMHAVCARASRPAADAIIICLGGAVRDGRPRPTLESRLEACRELAVEGPARTIVCTGALVRGEDVSEAEVMRRYLVARGVDDGRILVEDQARTTRENIEYSVALVRSLGLAGELCVCSSDYHLFRASEEGRRLGVKLKPVAARTPLLSRPEQWCREALTCAYHGMSGR